MKMPDMDGEQCFAKLKGIDPNAQVLLLSGYIQDKATQQLLEKGAVEFFQKPIMFSELVDWIVRRLEGGEETRLVP